MPTIDLKTLQENLAKSVVAVLEAQQASVIIAMNEFRADLNDRVFLLGEDVGGQKIGSYSTTPFYASLNSTSQVRGSSLKPKGKNASGDFKNGKQRKSQYMPGGYKEYRSVVGRQNEKVDLNLTGSLKGDIRLGQSSGSVELAFTTDKQLKIAEGNQNRFGKVIFAASQSEIDNIVNLHEEMVSKAFFDSFK